MNVVIFNKTTGRVTSYISSAHTVDYEGRDDVILNPVLPMNVPMEFWRVDGGILHEASPLQKNEIIEEKKEEQRKLIDRGEINAVDLAKALVALGVVNGPALRSKIKEQKGL